MMRSRFDEQLRLLNSKMIEMGSMCEEMIGAASKALTEGDVALARKIRREGGSVDQMEREIESLCMKLLLQQQPVARDLRQISAVLKMITDMERIGDQAEDIAEIIGFLGGRTIEGCEQINQMAEAAIAMVSESIDAYVKKDVQIAKQVLKQDDVVDDDFYKMKHAIIQYIMEHPQDGEFALDLLMISKYLERIGDHATNIAEWVIYSVTGEHKSDESHQAK